MRAEDDALCLDVVRDTADALPSLLQIPIVEIRMQDGATATPARSEG